MHFFIEEEDDDEDDASSFTRDIADICKKWSDVFAVSMHHICHQSVPAFWKTLIGQIEQLNKPEII